MCSPNVTLNNQVGIPIYRTYTPSTTTLPIGTTHVNDTTHIHSHSPINQNKTPK